MQLLHSSTALKMSKKSKFVKHKLQANCFTVLSDGVVEAWGMGSFSHRCCAMSRTRQTTLYLLLACRQCMHCCRIAVLIQQQVISAV